MTNKYNGLICAGCGEKDSREYIVWRCEQCGTPCCVQCGVYVDVIDDSLCPDCAPAKDVKREIEDAKRKAAP